MHLIKLLIIIGLLILFFHGLMTSRAQAEIPTRVTAIIGQKVSLTCYTGTFNGTVTWIVYDASSEVKITSCEENEQSCGEIGQIASFLASYNGTRNMTSSTLKVISKSDVSVHECRLNDETLRSYELTFLNLGDIDKPTCDVTPSVVSAKFQLNKINFTCDSSTNEGIKLFLQISFGEDSTAPTRSRHLSYKDDYALFTDSSQGSCEMSIEGVSDTWSCVFPTHVDIIPTTNGTDMVFECRAGGMEEGQISWSMLEPDGVLDIANRSWIRRGGRFMLLQEMTTDDNGRVVQCLVHQPGAPGNTTSIGFYQIEPDDDSTPPSSRGPNGNGAVETHTTKTYKGLFAFFFTVWLLTVATFLAWFVYPRAKAHWQPSTTGTFSSQRGKDQSKRIGEDNGDGQGIPDTCTYIFDKKSAVNSDEGNTSSNNNASSGDQRIRIPSREQVASTSLQSEANAVDNPLYFCVDRSSPPSLRSPSMTDEGNHDGVSELDLEGYDIVGESDQASFPTFSNEQNDYAEVTVRNNHEGNADSYLYGVVQK